MHRACARVGEVTASRPSASSAFRPQPFHLDREARAAAGAATRAKWSFSTCYGDYNTSACRAPPCGVLEHQGFRVLGRASVLWNANLDGGDRRSMKPSARECRSLIPHVRAARSSSSLRPAVQDDDGVPLYVDSPDVPARVRIDATSCNSSTVARAPRRGRTDWKKARQSRYHALAISAPRDLHP